MRIGIYDPYLDDLGGGEKYMMTVASCLSGKHEVSVFWDVKDDVKKINERFSIDLSKIKIEKNIFSPEIRLINRLSSTKKYDLIIVLTDGSIPLVSSRKLFLFIQQPFSGIKKLSVKDKLKLTRVHGIFYNSEFTKDFNKKIFQKVNSDVIYPPVEIIEKRLRKENIIIHVGRFRIIDGKIDDYKKQQVMIEVFKKMIDEGLKDWKFIIAASTSTNTENDLKLKNIIDSAKGYPIEFLINVNNESLWNLYNKAKIYWHASGFGEDLISHPELAEHFGISTVEAMGAGAVPIVISAGGQKEIVIDKENGFLWNKLDELSKITKSLINDEDLWQKLSARAKLRARDFSREQFCKNINNLLKL